MHSFTAAVEPVQECTKIDDSFNGYKNEIYIYMLKGECIKVRVVDGGGRFVVEYGWKEIQQAKNNCILGDGKCRFVFMLPECTLTLCNALDYFITHHKNNNSYTKKRSIYSLPFEWKFCQWMEETIYIKNVIKKYAKMAMTSIIYAFYYETVLKE